MLRWRLHAWCLLVLSLVLPTLAQASGRTVYFPVGVFSLQIEGQPTIEKSIYGSPRRALRAVWTWGVPVTEEGECLALGQEPPRWFKNATSLRMLIVPNIDAKGDPIYDPHDGDRQYLAVLERFTQVGQTVEVRHGCRRPIAQIEHEITTNPLGSVKQFPPLLNLQGGPLGPIHLRVSIEWGSRWDPYGYRY